MEGFDNFNGALLPVGRRLRSYIAGQRRVGVTFIDDEFAESDDDELEGLELKHVIFGMSDATSFWAFDQWIGVNCSQCPQDATAVGRIGRRIHVVGLELIGFLEVQSEYKEVFTDNGTGGYNVVGHENDSIEFRVVIVINDRDPGGTGPVPVIMDQSTNCWSPYSEQKRIGKSIIFDRMFSRLEPTNTVQFRHFIDCDFNQIYPEGGDPHVAGLWPFRNAVEMHVFIKNDSYIDPNFQFELRTFFFDD